MHNLQKNKTFVVIALVVFVATLIGLMFAENTGTSGGNNTIFIIMVSQIPIWLSVAARGNRKKKKSTGRKSKQESIYDLQDENFYDDKTLSAYDGEIVSYDEIDSASIQMN